MRLSNKHANVQSLDFIDFTGGLNTARAIETIDFNELGRSINMELSGNQLVTVSGTAQLMENEGVQFTDCTFDNINNLILICGKEYEGDVLTGRFVYKVSPDGTGFTKLGELTGSITPGFAVWESGVLIASGGKLQYWNGSTLETLADSPANCNGVFTSHGRVIVYYSDTVHYSAVGDETSWTDDPNDASSSKWLQVGYKDGGTIVGAVNLAQDILVFKSNNSAYHIAGQYPDWQVREISRNVDNKGHRAAISLTNSSLVLGRSMVQAIAPTDDYGEMRAANLAQKIESNIKALPDIVKLRFVAPLNQVWFMSGERRFLFFDVAHQAFFMREYNKEAVDVCYKGDTVFVLKEHELCYLDNGLDMLDGGELLRWAINAKTLVSQNDYLVKRVRVDITPLFQTYSDVRFYVGRIQLNDLVPKEANQIWHDYTKIYHNKRYIIRQPASAIYINSDEVYDNENEIYNNDTHIKSMVYVRKDKRQIDRNKAIRVYAKGSGGRFTLNRINCEIVEV
jgi:hypothetical protein